MTSRGLAMNNELLPFAFEDKLVRTIMDDGGEPWFVAKDVCRVLSIEWKGSATMARTGHGGRDPGQLRAHLLPPG